MKKTLFIFTLILTLVSCEDTLPFGGGAIPEGTSTVEVEVAYTALTPTLDSRASGTATKAIRSLWMVIYAQDGTYVEKRRITDYEEGTPTLDSNRRPDEATATEETTGCAKFRLSIANGRYKIFAVANCDLSGVADDDIDTIEKLRALPLTWDSTDAGANAQMFGPVTQAGKDHQGEAYPIVEIRGDAVRLHAWVRRAASKLTIAFDTTGLKNNIYIYFKSITVKDIPAECYLDRDNAPGHDDYTLANSLIDGETIYFTGAKAEHRNKEDHGKWPSIANGDSIFGLYSDRNGRMRNMPYTERIKREHCEDAPALYFYENMQGSGVKGEITDKRQDVTDDEKDLISYPDGTHAGSHNGDGTLKDDACTRLGWKDGKPWGTYVEIDGYYENNGSETPGKGPIRYRFMLGKDEHLDYNVERNHHYRLTMKFNGNANDVDFHVDYVEEGKPGTFAPDTAYVSYLYNQPGSTTVRGTPRPGYDLVKFECIILDNEWRPMDGIRGVDYYAEAWDLQVGGPDGTAPRDQYATHWTSDPAANENWYSNTYYKRDPEMADNTEFGFLSLRKIDVVTKSYGGGSDSYGKMVTGLRNTYFKTHKDPAYPGDCNGPINWREYTDIPRVDGTVTHTDEVDGGYSFTRRTNPYNPDEVDYIGEIPLFTRAKTLDTWGVYTGANPYGNRNRYARVKFIAHYSYVEGSGKPLYNGSKTYSEEACTHVLQAKRVDNPRGIYRRWDNTDPFFVRLTQSREYRDANGNVQETFETFNSKGPWAAYIECDPTGMLRLTANGHSVQGQGAYITGRTGTPVQFYISPTGKCADADVTRGAIVTVTYHNNSCVHQIVVRQGYAAHTFGHSHSKWSTFNVFDQHNLCRSPLSIGSMFRYHTNFSFPISEQNIDNHTVAQHPAEYYPYIIHGVDSTKVATRWGKIPFTKDSNITPFVTNTGAAGETGLRFYNYAENKVADYRIPTYKDLGDIGIEVDGHIPDKDFNFAYGISYADGATTTLLTEDAYRFTDYHNTGADSPKGVHSVIVFSKENGESILFSLGSTGHARRKCRGLDLAKDAIGQKGHVLSYGYMRYGNIDFYLGGPNRHFDLYRPLAWRLPDQKGGVYWVDALGGRAQAIDFNFANYMANYLNTGDLWLYGEPDALPVRLIHN